MIRIISYIFILLSYFISYFSIADERIKSYDVSIVINEDSTLDIIEKIVVNVEHKAIKLGITRDIPLSYQAHRENIETPILIHSVTRNGEEENFWIESENNKLTILIGAYDDLVENYLSQGEHLYEIHWSTQNHLRGFKDYDELYYNVTGNQWQFPIDKASATVSLPSNIQFKQAASYIGSIGSTEKGITEKIDDHTVSFKSPRPLRVGEGLTVAVGFTGGVLVTASQPNWYDVLVNKIIEFAYPYLTYQSVALLFIFLLSLFYYFCVWLRYGKDDDLGVVVPQFEPPDGISPAKATAIWFGRRANPKKMLTASLINLAASGFINIKEESLVRNATKGSVLPKFPEEEKLFKTLFGKQLLGRTVLLDKYNRKMSNVLKDYRDYLKTIREEYIQEYKQTILIALFLQLALFILLPDAKTTAISTLAFLLLVLFYTPFFYMVIRLMYSKSFIIGIVIFGFLAFHLSFFLVIPAYFGGMPLNAAYYVFLILVLFLVGLHFVFYYLMDKPNSDAVEILRELAGLKMFLETVHKDEYKLITPDVFEKNLPYAIAFGVEKEWIKRFEALYPQYEPSWSSSRAVFSGSLTSTLVSNIISSTRQVSSGGGGYSSGGGSSSSGSSGRGSSGGGSGGGGGGGR